MPRLSSISSRACGVISSGELQHRQLSAGARQRRGRTARSHLFQTRERGRAQPCDPDGVRQSCPKQPIGAVSFLSPLSDYLPLNCCLSLFSFERMRFLSLSDLGVTSSSSSSFMNSMHCSRLISVWGTRRSASSEPDGCGCWSDACSCECADYILILGTFADYRHPRRLRRPRG